LAKLWPEVCTRFQDLETRSTVFDVDLGRDVFVVAD
jgi:hypothetical protein